MPEPIVHKVTFERNTVTGRWRGFCSGCYWCRTGSQEEIQAQAATHDMEWVEVKPTPAPAHA